MVVGVLLSCAVIAFLYYYVIHLARFRRLINLIPGPQMFPIFGDVANVYDRSGEDLWDLRDLRFKRHRPIYKLWSLTIANVVLSHPDDIQTILNNTKYNTKGLVYKLLHSWMGDGLLVSKGTAT
ncbi:hypothetical protein DMN91_001858 [Ooceraea biroi]|uniref:Cytochrome P450 4C1 n=1 Tax=Ooceraea biroi TaxID=2015173 RepID=A0A3L8DZ16_OOCBI|nr:hypothetical protein DMN91_001858 [Ooceraea biroi]